MRLKSGESDLRITIRAASESKFHNLPVSNITTSFAQNDLAFDESRSDNALKKPATTFCKCRVSAVLSWHFEVIAIPIMMVISNKRCGIVTIIR